MLLGSEVAPTRTCTIQKTSSFRRDSNAMSLSLLEKLPKEIFLETAGLLDAEDLLNSRLINRNISNDLDHVFSRRFFRRRAVRVNSDSLNILRQVSLSEKFRASVTSLDVCIHHIPGRHSDYLFDWFSSRARTMMITNHPRYANLLRDQNWLMESGQAAAILTSTLKDLPNCITITISNRIYDVYHTFLKFNEDRLLTTTMSLSTSVDFVKQLLSTTMAAIIGSGRILETLHIHHDFEGIQIEQLPRLSPGQLGLSFSRLYSLTLVLECTDIQNDGMARLSDWIKLFPSLTYLDLLFNPELHREDFLSISQGLHIDGIPALALGFVKCHPDDVVVLLKKNHDTLKSISLYKVNLTGCVKPWRSLLESVRDETLINSIDLNYCLSDHEDISFGVNPSRRHLIIPTESQKFSEELDAIISVL